MFNVILKFMVYLLEFMFLLYILWFVNNCFLFIEFCWKFGFLFSGCDRVF